MSGMTGSFEEVIELIEKIIRQKKRYADKNGGPWWTEGEMELRTLLIKIKDMQREEWRAYASHMQQPMDECP